MSEEKPDWREQGVRVVRGDQLDTNTPQTPGMNRAAIPSATSSVSIVLQVP